MKFSTLIKHSAGLIKIIKNSSSPADKLTSEHLRSKKYLGSNDRKIISELVFSMLRTMTLVEKASENYLFESKISSLNEEQIQILNVITSIIINKHIHNEYFDNLIKSLKKINNSELELENNIHTAITELGLNEINSDHYINYINQFSKDFIEKINSNHHLLNSELCLSDTVLNSFRKKYDNKSINLLALELMKPAQLNLRVNTLIADVDDILNQLSQANINAKRSTLSPVGIIISERVNLMNHDFFKNGQVEVQDIGSQLISYALDPAEGTNILDACAGAGGKSLHIATLTNDKANIIASDIEFKRLKEIRIRARKAGLNSIESIVIKENSLQNKIHHKFDYILIDAPCSGLGTVRRMPMPKYRLNEKLLNRITNNQFEILTYYSKFLKDGGILLYSTCSLLIEENENIIGRFLNENTNFSPSPLIDSFNKYNIAIPAIKNSDFSLALNPTNGETDGFFMAKIQKN